LRKPRATETHSKLDSELLAKWIEPNSRKDDPAEALVLPGHISVWAVVRQLEFEDQDIAAVADFYALPVEAVDTAMRYYRKHRVAVDARIARNRAFFAAL
jgi:hypothetical protein